MPKNNTGMKRPVDNLGRVVVPKELRDSLGWTEKDLIAIHMDGENVVLHKYNEGCAFCGNKEHTVHLGDKLICRSCMKAISQLFADQ